jgi:alkylresorcinol/alkylpyrone synthase
MTTAVSAHPSPGLADGWPPLAPAVRLAGLGTATPPRRVSRQEIVEVLPRIWPELARRASLLIDPAADEGYRHLLRDPAEMVDALPLSQQTARYVDAAPELAAAAAERALAAAGDRREAIGLLVVSSCTGFILPGLDAHLLPRLGLRPDVRRLPMVQLGCAGGAGGLAHAADWARTHPGQQALVVAVELPSLTFRPGDHSLDNLLSALVFGDGAGAGVLEADGDDPAGGLHVGRARSVLVPHSVNALGYDLADDGYRVILSRRLPAILAAALPALIDEFCGRGAAAGLDAVALHPGGRAIIDAVAGCLGLRDTQLAATRAVMRTTGNTSSAAIFFVLEELAASLPSRSGSGLILGLGPGLNVELLELTWDS